MGMVFTIKIEGMEMGWRRFELVFKRGKLWISKNLKIKTKTRRNKIKHENLFKNKLKNN